MKKTALAELCIVILMVCLLSGCATYPTFSGVFGVEVRDLEKAKSHGKNIEVPSSYDAAFDNVLAILKKDDITAYQVNRKKGYIVAMDFPKQTDTTRVGIFFDRQDAGHTLITLSSLSSTALTRAEGIIFGGLQVK